MKNSIFLLAGEPSGDLHGSHLLSALRERMPTMIFSGVGGPKMRLEGLSALMAMEEFAVMGFSDVLCALPRLWQRFRVLCSHIIKTKPLAVVLIDYPGFNLRLAKALRKRGYQGKIVQYVAPTVWAWGKGRISVMEKNLDLLLTIYPFEEKHFTQSALKVKYVGHPLCEQLRNYSYRPQWKEELGIPVERPLIALFPGSRPAEITRNLPLQFRALEIFLARNPQHSVALSCAAKGVEEAIRAQLHNIPLSIGREVFLVPESHTYDLMQGAHVALAKSGTVTLELALHHCPTIVNYQLTPLNRFIAKYCFGLKLPYYCIANILAKEELFPEFIERKASAADLATALCAIDKSSRQRQNCLEGCAKIATQLNSHTDGSQRAAQAIAELLT